MSTVFSVFLGQNNEQKVDNDDSKTGGIVSENKPQYLGLGIQNDMDDAFPKMPFPDEMDLPCLRAPAAQEIIGSPVDTGTSNDTNNGLLPDLNEFELDLEVNSLPCIVDQVDSIDYELATRSGY